MFGGGGAVGYGFGRRRTTALTAFLLFTLGFALLIMIILLILFLITLFSGTYITWTWVVLWLPWGTATGLYIAATVDSKQQIPFFLQHSITATLLNGLGLIFNVLAGYYYISLWFACVPGWGNLDTLQKVMCNDEEWVVWVTAIASFLVVLVSLGQTLTAAYDAFVRVTGTRAFSAAQRGLEGATDRFGGRFQEAFGRARRLGGTAGDGLPVDENELLGDDEEDLYAGSRMSRKATQKKRSRQAKSRRR
jgi:signal transduction histidine kinase